MNTIRDLSLQLGASERTLRRSACSGLIRCNRPSARKLQVSASERLYLHHHWNLLSGLRRSLRTEPNITLAAVFGSFARGDDELPSDIDLLVSLREDNAWETAGLEERLSVAVGRNVEIARLSLVNRDPHFLSEILKDGRVLIDREDEWASLNAQATKINQAASRERAARKRRAATAIDLLTHT